MMNPDKYQTNFVSITSAQVRRICDLLESRRPSSILEFGAGVSSQVFIDYAEETGAYFLNIESEDHWMTKYSVRCNLIHQSPYEIDGIKFDNVNYYENLTDVISGRKYDFVLIDGPIGWQWFYKYTRVQMLEVIPHLADECVVMIHDSERITSQRVQNIFKRKVSELYDIEIIDYHLKAQNMTEYHLKRRSN